MSSDARKTCILAPYKKKKAQMDAATKKALSLKCHLIACRNITTVIQWVNTPPEWCS